MAQDPIYALCAKGPTLTLATAVTLSQGVLSISPVLWKFIEGSWDDTEPLATGDWRAFFLSNLGEASLDVTDIRLTSEAPSDWVLDSQCGTLPAIGTLEPGSARAVCVRYERAAPGTSRAKLIVESTGGNVKSTLIGGVLVDSDDDGVADEEEWGPDRNEQSFDGNGDGTPDGEQAHVASLHSADGAGYVTIAISEGGGSLEEVTPGEEPKGGEWEWPWGFYAFRVTGFTGPVVVEMFLHEGRTDAPVSYYVKYGRQDRVGEPTYYVFEYEESAGTGAESQGRHDSASLDRRATWRRRLGGKWRHRRPGWPRNRIHDRQQWRLQLPNCRPRVPGEQPWARDVGLRPARSRATSPQVLTRLRVDHFTPQDAAARLAEVAKASASAVRNGAIHKRQRAVT